MFLGSTYHVITDENNDGILIELGEVNVINHIKILIWDIKEASFSYFIEVSLNMTQWDVVIDHTTSLCQSWQDLYFPATAVRYIRLVGTFSTNFYVSYRIIMKQ